MIAVLVAALLMQQSPSVTPPKTADNVRGPVICRNEPLPGTRITSSVCMTRQDWSTRQEAWDQHRARNRPVIDNRRMGRGIGRW